jgi:hypothetical protein
VHDVEVGGSDLQVGVRLERVHPLIHFLAIVDSVVIAVGRVGVSMMDLRLGTF